MSFPRTVNEKAARVEPTPVTLEKADVSLQQVTVVWVPVAPPG